MIRILTFLCALAASAGVLAQTPAPAAGTPAPPNTAKPDPTGAATAARPTLRTTAARPAAPAGTAPAAPEPSAPVPVASLSDEHKTIYALGLALEEPIHSLGFSPEEMALIARGMADAAMAKPGLDLQEWGPRIDPFAQARLRGALLREEAASAAYLDQSALRSGAVRTSSGLVYRELRAGIGGMPKATDTVKVRYRGTLRTGTVFEDSYELSEPAAFAVDGVIPCWTEGLQLMRVGGKAELVCPAALAYGRTGNEDIPGGAALHFEIDLLEIVKTP